MTNNTSYNLIDGSMIECPKNKGKYITHGYLSYSDYSNATNVHRSNVDYIIENYATNRYYVITYAYNGCEIYLKNTALNRELIDNLYEYPIINDEYYYQWQTIHAKEQFLESCVNEYPVIAAALDRIDSDTDWTISNKIYKCVEYFSQLWYACVYEWSGDRYYFSLEREKYNTTENVDLVYQWFIDNGVYEKMDASTLQYNILPIVNRLYTNSQSLSKAETYIYTLQLQSYHQIVLHSGSSDYMTDHTYPLVEIELDPKMTKQSIAELVKYTYNTIAEDSYEQLDILPI